MANLKIEWNILCLSLIFDSSKIKQNDKYSKYSNFVIWRKYKKFTIRKKIIFLLREQSVNFRIWGPSTYTI